VRTDVVLDVAASVAAIAAVSGLLYARASVRAARDATAAAQRAAQLAFVSRQSAERARLRHRVERVGELVQEVAFSSHVDTEGDGLSPRTRAQCDVLNQAVIGLENILPTSVQLCRARSSAELQERADKARAEIARVLAGLEGKRMGKPRTRAYRGRYNRRVPWHRSTKRTVRSR